MKSFVSTLVVIFLLIVAFAGCKKDKTGENEKNEYKKITIVRTTESNVSEIDSLIFELNDNLTLKSIKEYSLYVGRLIFHESVQKFVYFPNTERIDSSFIITKNEYGVIDTFSERYIYSGDRIIQVIRPLQEFGHANDTMEYTYDQSGKIIHIYETYQFQQGTVQSNCDYLYNGHNLSSSTKYDEYFEFDNKINPLNTIFKQSRYPIFQGKYTMFPMEYCFSENNPKRANINIRNDININQSINVNQTFTYNQYGYPTEIFSNWGNFNIKLYYE
jgi:hypothetical protein